LQMTCRQASPPAWHRREAPGQTGQSPAGQGRGRAGRGRSEKPYFPNTRHGPSRPKAEAPQKRSAAHAPSQPTGTGDKRTSGLAGGADVEARGGRSAPKCGKEPPHIAAHPRRPQAAAAPGRRNPFFDSAGNRPGSGASGQAGGADGQARGGGRAPRAARAWKSRFIWSASKPGPATARQDAQ
jgi:hypothetical protein